MARALSFALLAAVASIGTSRAEDGNAGDTDLGANVSGPGNHSVYPWFLIDAPLAVCVDANPPAPGKAVVSLNLTSLVHERDEAEPHIFTIFRETTNAVKLTLQVTDADGKVVVDTMDLAMDAFDNETQSPSARRLVWSKRTSSYIGKRRSPGFSSSSRRSAPSRDGASLASFSYGSQASLVSRFPRGYRKTSYGYSGSGAWRQQDSGYSGMMIGATMAFGIDPNHGFSTDDTLYKYSRWKSQALECHMGSATQTMMSCADCAAKHGTDCAPELPPVANRDDLMDTGFWPEDYTSPLTVTITSIEGHDFSPNILCASGLASNDKLTEAARKHSASDIFLTLTKMEKLEAQLVGEQVYKKDQEEQSDIASWFFASCLVGFGVLVCFCACCWYLCGKCSEREEQDTEGYEGLRQK